MTQVSKSNLDLIFNEARTHRYWLNKEVDDALLQQAYQLAVMGPTSGNCLPMRIVFVKSAAAKERLKPALDKGNIDKTMSVPVTAIIAYDLEFYNKLPTLYPHGDAKSWYVGKEEYTKTTAFRNSSLQGAYFIIALRSLGLDVGPMSGFNNEMVDNEFFKGTAVKSNFLINIGYGDKSKLYPRDPRLVFDEACKIV